ncbi:MAG: hypothetical protein KJ771_03095 [Nanoarchaeota archaeon]|nr:hypothetical protein [Nanoarchaeota archaeon]
MAKLKSKETEIFEELVEKKVGEIRKYRNLINALIACYEFFSKKESYTCYLGKVGKGSSPDLIVKSKDEKHVDIIGDGKKGLMAPPSRTEDESWEDYLKREDVKTYLSKVLDLINKGINKYAKQLEYASEPHDFFTLCPTEKRVAIKLLEKDNKIHDNAIILSFDFTNDETKYVLRIVKERGNFTDSDINNEFELGGGLFHQMQNFAELMSRYKLYLAEKEDDNAPIEWIMFVIWQYILPESANSNQKERIIAQLNNGYMIIEVTLKEICDYIRDNYRLPTFPDDKELITYKIVRSALHAISLLTEVKIIEGENSPNPKYRIIWKKLQTQNLLHEFVIKIHGEQFKAIAKKQVGKTENKPVDENQTSLVNFKKE